MQTDSACAPPALTAPATRLTSRPLADRGDLCGQGVVKTRTVVVSADGATVLAVCGDGTPHVAVSARPNDRLKLTRARDRHAAPRYAFRAAPARAATR